MFFDLALAARGLRLGRCALALVCSLLCMGLLPRAVEAGKANGRLDIYWIDAEGGAATLIVTPEDESILIDTGNPGFRDADRIVRTVVEQAKLRKIDHLITTHYHRDHFGGAAELAQSLPIGVIYDNGKFAGMPDDPGQDYFDLKSDQRVVLQPGDRIPLRSTSREGSPSVRLACAGARQQFISPPEGAAENANVCAESRAKDRDGSDNANSIVLLLEYGTFRFFDAGDLTWNQEARLVCPHNLVGEVDVYQVTHHGLDASNNPVVLRSLQPRVAIMNNGSTKGCMPEVFANLRETRSIEAIYQVHKNERPDGAVNDVADEYIANHAADKCAGNVIRLSVHPSGNEYTVAIPAHQHERTFKSKVQAP